MSNPRNDDAILCKNHSEVEAIESWPWKKSDRLCGLCMENAYAGIDAQIRQAKIDGPRIRYQDEQAPDGRYFYKDNAGFYRRHSGEL